MVQELHVLKCFSCETFQTQIVKKTNKWECKICGSKQSIKKVYGRGSGKDCRIHTQKLNSLKGEKCELQILAQENLCESEELTQAENHPSTFCEESISSNGILQDACSSNKWNVYLEDKGEESIDEDSTCQIKPLQANSFHDFKKRKRSYDIADSGCEENISLPPSSRHVKPRLNYQNKDKNEQKKNCNSKGNSNSETCYNLHDDYCIDVKEQKLPKQSSTRLETKVGLKWSKYLDTNESCSEHSPSEEPNSTDCNQTVCDETDIFHESLQSKTVNRQYNVPVDRIANNQLTSVVKSQPLFEQFSSVDDSVFQLQF